MNPINSLSPEMNRRLVNTKKIAETSNEGTISFMELSYYPLVSLYITTGERKVETNNLKHLHLRYMGEPSNYPNFDLENKSPHKLGYENYSTLITPKDHHILSFNRYKTLFDSVVDEINGSISKYHGYKCYEDGNSNNGGTRNIIILHICDVINIISCQDDKCIPDLFIKTRLMSELDVRMCEELDIHFSTVEIKEFFRFQMDFFYLCYAYFGNTSFVPIRTSVDIESDILNKSSFFTNDEHFINHQHGKLKELNQTEHNSITRIVYRSI